MAGRSRPKPVSNHKEVDPLILQYAHEKQRPREAEALQTLKKIASLVKPLMRARGWKVRTLQEFYPDQQNLLGMNKGRGQTIYLRLRYAGDANQFLPIEEVTDTMLHELSHNVFGEHDEKFHALWEELRNEYEGLVLKGYTGEGFLSEGHRLGGQRIPKDEAKRIRRVAAEKRAASSKGSGQKLGGRAVPLGSDMRKVIADAIERRSTITKGCGSGGNKNSREIEAISEQANKHGFKTQAEEDQANEAMIAQLLWEFHQEDEKEKYGSAYIPPTFSVSSSFIHSAEPATNEASSSRLAAPPLPAGKPNPAKPLASANSGPRNKSNINRSPPSKRQRTNSIKALIDLDDNIPAPKFWTCPACTYAQNPLLHLCCDICDGEQPMSVIHDPHRRSNPVAKAKSGPSTRPLPSVPMSKTWVCHLCAKEMENQWWTCSDCGTLKLESKA